MLPNSVNMKKLFVIGIRDKLRICVTSHGNTFSFSDVCIKELHFDETTELARMAEDRDSWTSRGSSNGY